MRNLKRAQPGSGFRYAPGHDGRGPALRALTTSATTLRSSTRTPWRSPLPSASLTATRTGPSGPKNVVTRAEMAVIISTMLYGAGVNVNQFAETNVFTDVPAWAQGYVNLCSSLGIVAGGARASLTPTPP